MVVGEGVEADQSQHLAVEVTSAQKNDCQQKCGHVQSLPGLGHLLQIARLTAGEE